MLRVLLALAGFLVLPLAAVVACNDVETTPAPDAAPPPCDQGPFVFDDQGNRAVAPSVKPEGPSCSADGTDLEVINKLPRGGFYGVGWKVNYVGTRDQQGDCKLQTVCVCTQEDETSPPPEPADAGPDADAATTAPPPTTTPGAPHWVCQ